MYSSLTLLSNNTIKSVNWIDFNILLRVINISKTVRNTAYRNYYDYLDSKTNNGHRKALLIFYIPTADVFTLAYNAYLSYA